MTVAGEYQSAITQGISNLKKNGICYLILNDLKVNDWNFQANRTENEFLKILHWAGYI